MNYKLLMQLEMERNELVRAELAKSIRRETELRTQLEAEKMMVVSLNNEITEIQDVLQHINSRVNSYGLGGQIDVRA